MNRQKRETHCLEHSPDAGVEPENGLNELVQVALLLFLELRDSYEPEKPDHPVEPGEPRKPNQRVVLVSVPGRLGLGSLLTVI